MSNMSGWRDARNVLAVRLDNIGDIVMLGPALRAVKETSPDARMTLMASPAGTTGAPLLPWVDDVITWRAVWQDLGHLPFDPTRELELVAMLRERAFDAALIFTSFSQSPHSPGYVCYLAGIPLRAGESREFGGATLSHEFRSASDDLHQVDRNLRLVEHVGFTTENHQLEISIGDSALLAARSILQEAGIDLAAPYIIVHPGASAKARRYPTERFAEVAARLMSLGHQVVVPGTDREAAMLAEMKVHAPNAAYLIGGTTVPEYAAMVEGAALVICNNSLPMHLADALMTPAVVLYSGTDIESQWRPRYTSHVLLRHDTPCYPCYRFDCPIGLPCLDFTPDEVVATAERLLADSAVRVLEGVTA